MSAPGRMRTRQDGRRGRVRSMAVSATCERPPQPNALVTRLSDYGPSAFAAALFPEPVAVQPPDDRQHSSQANPPVVCGKIILRSIGGGIWTCPAPLSGAPAQSAGVQTVKARLASRAGKGHL
jgi:hypothetical protein